MRVVFCSTNTIALQQKRLLSTSYTSHGDHEAHGATIARIREAAASRPHLNIGILLDTKGPEIRTGAPRIAHAYPLPPFTTLHVAIIFDLILNLALTIVRTVACVS